MNKALVVIGVFIILLFIGMVIMNQQAISSKQAGQLPFNQLTPTPTSVLSLMQSGQSAGNPTTSASAPSPTKAIEENEIPATVTATIKTAKGSIVIEMETKDTPNTIVNFVTKAKSGFYKNLIFHRVEDWVIQGGDPTGTGRGGGNIKTELNKKSFVKGAVGVARGGDIEVSNDSQFFIVKTDADWLNEQYTYFGMVTSGMDVVEKISVGDKILEVIIE